MTLAPIIERELTSALRTKDALKTRMRFALSGAAPTLFLMLLGNQLASGQAAHTLLFIVGLWIALIQTPVLTADLFSSERRNQTLPLLMLAGLPPMQLFVQKLLGGALVAFTNLLALAPFLALPFLSGGLSLSLFLCTVGCLPLLLLLALSVTILASVCCGEEGETLALATTLGIVLAALTPGLILADRYLMNTALVSSKWLLLSPAYGPFMILRKFATGSPAEFWRNSAVTLGWSCLLLSVAARVLKYTWQDQESPRSGATNRMRFRAWLHGTQTWRRVLGHRWLDQNPFTWLALRERSSERLGWIFIGGIFPGLLLAWAVWPSAVSGALPALLVAILVNASLEALVFYTAGKRLGDERRSGTFEPLLTTCLEVPEIIEGQMRALQSRFRPMFWSLLIFNSALMIQGFSSRSWDRESFCVYSLLWAPILAWSFRRKFRIALPVIWASLNSGRPAYAAWKCSGLGSFVWIWVFLNLIRSLNPNSGAFPTGSLTEFIWTISGYGFLALLLLAHRYSTNSLERRLLNEFRSIAQEAAPAVSDPRFKTWKVQERFPSD